MRPSIEPRKGSGGAARIDVAAYISMTLAGAGPRVPIVPMMGGGRWLLAWCGTPARGLAIRTEIRHVPWQGAGIRVWRFGEHMLDFPRFRCRKAQAPRRRRGGFGRVALCRRGLLGLPGLVRALAPGRLTDDVDDAPGGCSSIEKFRGHRRTIAGRVLPPGSRFLDPALSW